MAERVPTFPILPLQDPVWAVVLVRNSWDSHTATVVLELNSFICLVEHHHNRPYVSELQNILDLKTAAAARAELSDINGCVYGSNPTNVPLEELTVNKEVFLHFKHQRLSSCDRFSADHRGIAGRQNPYFVELFHHPIYTRTVSAAGK